MFSPSKEEFLKLSQKGNLIPVYREILADLETPVSAYLKIAKESKYSFLLESVEGEEKIARFSFLARDPQLVFKSKGNQAEIIRDQSGSLHRESFEIKNSPLEFIRRIMADFQFVALPGLPRFCGGLVGYIGYDVVRFFENLPKKPKDDLGLSDIMMILAKDIVIFDHVNHKIKVISCVHIDKDISDSEKLRAYDQAASAVTSLIEDLSKPLDVKSFFAPQKTSSSALKIGSNVSEDEFKKMVSTAKRKIRAGDIIQVVLSQRFEVSCRTHPLNLYRALRSVNPSPYMYYLNFDGTSIVGSSPELLVRCENKTVETRPIAGTRKRGADGAEDLRLMKDLLNDPKEKAEHIMLVDLGRNDLGRVCQKGTVKVSEFMAIEKYSHVMHIVSNVTGTLRSGQDAFDVLKAAFPAGTVSGAPKIRAMEIIDELENVSRGPYAGCIGYISFSGNLDTCITIRTIVHKDQKAYIQAGAGIVADSNPKREYIETQNKAKALIKAIDMAHNDINP